MVEEGNALAVEDGGSMGARVPKGKDRDLGWRGGHRQVRDWAVGFIISTGILQIANADKTSKMLCARMSDALVILSFLGDALVNLNTYQVHARTAQKKVQYVLVHLKHI
jgi:hypothetical protein